MKPHRTSQLARVVIVLVTIAAWFVASDHCALASVLIHPAKASPAQEHCPGHSQPEKKQSQGELPCCKSLVATATPTKIFAGYDTSQFVAQPYLTTDPLLVFTHHDAPSAELDTGPPDACTFAESVLQRSILAHAPPALGLEAGTPASQVVRLLLRLRKRVVACACLLLVCP